VRREWPWLLGGIGVALSALGWLVEPSAFRHAWLAALTVWLEWPLGSLALLLAHALTGGQWGMVLRPALLAGVATLPLLVPASLPIVLPLDALYPWARAAVPNAFYLNVPFFAARGAIYLIVWFGLGALVLRALRRGASLKRLAPPGLLLLAFTVTFAAIDTTLSLDPGFNSSIWGMIAAAASGLLALAVATLLSAGTAPRHVLPDCGRLLLGLLVLWAYLDFMQFLIVWQSDLPDEAAWYVARSSGIWADVALSIGVGHGLLPFAALIFPAVRRSRAGIMAVCGWLIAMEAVRGWWLVLPSQPRGLSWIDIACALAFFGLAVGIARHAPKPEPAYV
jgi:hypothetical protein